ncbi:cell wall-binding protein [Clostridium beijerinckii]|uniref:cell wall-binding protein n=1 Tax=Clostridium beijerinckii TaxID=1520 RepID=UPI001493E34B|nr:cell wall-binding protein [Clostridium beijerinckii]NOW06382.1 hypothetical protein [Clostridium beijerinckii]NYC00474.1 hypothetical protein [Clostridium beijerinckii]
MKKLLSFICLLVIALSGLFYQVYIRRGNEEIEVLNTDVSINNIKSIIEIENNINDDYEEIPLGYNNGSVYLIKYDYINKKLYDNNIFILNKDGSSKECGVKLPDDYLNGELNIYGDKIFGRNGYFNWQSGKEYKLLSDDDNIFQSRWYSVSGNSDYYLRSEDKEQNKKYTLYNINSNDKYEFECNSNSEDVISGVFYDDISKRFYAMCQNNAVKQMQINEGNFTIEKYDDIKVLNKNLVSQEEKFKNSYVYCSEGQAYIGLDCNDKYQDSININQYDIVNKVAERLDNISLYGYDDFYKDYILIKKDDDKSVNKIYLAKLEKNGFDMLIEIPKLYGDDSKISIRMVDSENVLVKEEYHDKENKKIKNRYVVYDLSQYFQDNTNKLRSDNDKLTLKNTYKNINEYDDSNNKSKLDTEEVKQPEQTPKDITPKEDISKENTSKDNESNTKTTQEKDYRESDSSWRKGNGDWYYYKNDEKAIGWLKTEKGWYYFYKDGTMQKDAIVIGKNGKEYKLGHDGLLLNPDSELDYDYAVSKEKTNKENNSNNTSGVNSSATSSANANNINESNIKN